MNYCEQETQTLLKERLKNETLCITFTKKDGSTRRMQCTLDKTKLPNTEEKTSSRSFSSSSLPVFDLEASAWRSFRWDSIISVE